MVKCPHGKEGDACFDKNFRNQTALDMHIKHKHKEAKSEPSKDVEGSDNRSSDRDDIAADELRKEDIGL